MTVPLCDEPNAEQTCEQCLQEALTRDPVNLDALQAMANLRILRERDAEAKELLQKVVDLTLHLQDEHKKSTTVGEIVKGKAKGEMQEMPSVQFRLQTSRHLVELQMDKAAIKVLEGVVNEDDEQIEAWYLLAFVLHRMAKYSTCLECANNVVALATKLNVKDADLLAGTDEIIKDCKKKLDKAENVQVIQGQTEDDSGFETMSEEDIGSGSDAEMKE